MKTIKKFDKGPAVEDVQKRLRVLDYPLTVDGEFLDMTEAAIVDFRKKMGLGDEAIVDQATWSALVDATFSLGDRMLYLRMPYFHGKDVRALQGILEVLGFVSGGADGIFGAHTENALREFQSSVGLDDDGVAGASTFAAVQRLRHAWEGKSAPAEDTQEHMGFSRAAEALENMEVCFFGMDDQGRIIANRAANLAQATTPFSHVACAETLSVTPPDTMIMVGVVTQNEIPRDGSPVVVSRTDYSFQNRLSTALSVAREKTSRLYIMVDSDGVDFEDQNVLMHWQQRVAVSILDGLCAAWK